MTRRQFGGEFKREAVQLVTVRGVSVAQAARELGVHATVLRCWTKQYGADPSGAFHGEGQITLADDELRQLPREVAKLKAERDIPKKPRPTSQRTTRDVRLHCEALGDLAGQLDVRGGWCLTERPPFVSSRLFADILRSAVAVDLGCPDGYRSISHRFGNRLRQLRLCREQGCGTIQEPWGCAHSEPNFRNASDQCWRHGAFEAVITADWAPIWAQS